MSDNRKGSEQGYKTHSIRQWRRDTRVETCLLLWAYWSASNTWGWRWVGCESLPLQHCEHWDTSSQQNKQVRHESVLYWGGCDGWSVNQTGTCKSALQADKTPRRRPSMHHHCRWSEQSRRQVPDFHSDFRDASRSHWWPQQWQHFQVMQNAREVSQEVLDTPQHEIHPIEMEK